MIEPDLEPFGAAGSFSLRACALVPMGALPVRNPEHGETPLSSNELDFAIRKGLIRARLSEQGSVA